MPLTYQPQTSTSLYGYALILPDRDPLYLPLKVRPQSVGLQRNISLSQPPYTEAPLPRGDGRRKVGPLVLTGEFDRDVLQEPTEDGVRLYLAELDRLTPRAVGIQRGQSILRELFPFGYVTATPNDILSWSLTFTLFPTGPDWIDQTTGARSPF